MISPETIAQVRERTDIVAVVQESVPSLKRRGRSFVGLCPFHKEKSPSFHVNADRGFFHCFGCHEGGSVIDFVMKERGYTFPEAVRELAERAGIAIEEEHRDRTEVDRVKKQKDDVYSVNALAATFYEKMLREHPLKAYAERELAKRGVVPGKDPAVDEALQAFRVGYAPAAWDGLANFLKQQGVSPIAGESAGLLVPRSSGQGHYDRFAHRLMFAVVDAQGRVVAFSGRALDDAPEAPRRDEKPAKYINSPESPVYTKGHNLFGLFQARHSIRQAEQAILVEGNFDVFSLHARGLTNVVAPLGTAFTIDQAKLLKRYASTVVLLFDGDAAGKKAMRASREPCHQAGLTAKVASLPDGKDPDDLARGPDGINAVKAVIADAKGMLEALIDASLDEEFAAADAHERLARVEQIVKILSSETDPLVHMMAKSYADTVAGRLDLRGVGTFRALEEKMRAAAREAGPRLPPPSADHRNARITQKTPGSAERAEIVGCLLDYPELLSDPGVEPALARLEGPAVLTVMALRSSLSVEKRLDTSRFLAQIPPAIQAFASERLAAPRFEKEDEAKAHLLDNAQKLERLILAQETGDLAREMSRATGDSEADTDRLRQAQDLARRRHNVETKHQQNQQGQRIERRVERVEGSGVAPHEEEAASERDDDGGDGAE